MSDRIFVGNTPRWKAAERIKYFHDFGVKSATAEEDAVDINGEPLPDYMRLMIDRSDQDAHNDAMMTLTYGRDWKRRIYRG